MHNMFHAALLQTHVPNDDQLFPGQMDMQLALGEDWEGKWAVEKIILHSKIWSGIKASSDTGG